MRSPSPEVVVETEDLTKWLLSLLTRELRIAELRLSGMTVNHIANLEGKSRRTLERMLHEIRETWMKATRDR